MLTKYAECETLSVESADQTTTKVVRVAHRADFSHVERRQGYIYVRSRAISSRTNDNYDAFPAEEIKKAYGTFMGKPVFVNHKNSNHRRARGVIVAVALHEDTNPDGSPDTWAEVLMEVDAVRFPVLAREVEKGNIARTSMGTDVQYSTCTACGNKAYTPADYCAHIPKMKGMKIRRVNAATGRSEEVLIAEVCYGLGFFENSLLVEPPADPTAFVLGVEHGDMAKAASLQTEAATCPRCNPDMDGLTVLCRSHNFQQQHGAIDFPSHNIPKPGFEYPVQSGPARFSAVQALLASDDYQAPPPANGFTIGEAVNTEWGPGQVINSTGRTVTIALESGEEINIQNGVPGMDRLRAMNPKTSVRRISQHVSVSRDDLVHRPNPIDVFREEMRQAMHRRLAYGETKAPAKVDTMRAEACPVCGDDEGYSGEQCNVCGYTQPPEQFRDPDLSKAKEMDLRQDQQDAANVPDPGFTQEVPAEQQQAGDLKCSNCGEVFSAEGDATTDTDATDPEAPPEADPQHPEDPANPDSKKARDPHDLSDLADTPDEELLEDDDQEDPKVKKTDPNEVVDPKKAPDDPKAPDPAATGEGRVRPDDPEEADANRAAVDDVIEPGAVCPICGEGTLVASEPPKAEDDLDPTPDPTAAPPKANKVPPKNSSRHRAGDVQKESQSLFSGHEAGEEGSSSRQGRGNGMSAVARLLAAERVSLRGTPEGLRGGLRSDPSGVSGRPRLVEGMQAQALRGADTSGGGHAAGEPAPSTRGQGPSGSVRQGSRVHPREHHLEAERTASLSHLPEGVSARALRQEVSASVDRRATMSKETVDMPNPNPAQQRRSRIIAAIAEQQGVIEALQRENASLTRAVATLAIAAGAGKHPQFAGLVRQAGLTHLADSAQNPEGAPATTTQEAKQPQATDDVNSPGAAPGTVNKDVTPAAVTDVQNSNVAVNPPVLDNLQDVTAPVAGTDAVTPAAGDAAGTSTVTVGTPDQKSFDSTGPSWKSSARGTERERFVASVRLARLQIEAGTQQGEDMIVAASIDQSEASLEAIEAQISAMESVKQASTASAAQQARSRGLVPRAAQRQGGIQSASAPSLQTQAQAVTSRPGEDEWGVGLDDLG